MNQGRRLRVAFVIGALIATVIAVWWWRRDREPTRTGSETTASERVARTGLAQTGARADSTMDVRVLSENTQP
ncbi:MAG: hypothetical protein ACKV2T_08385 [Kofleriaceae bacterium]